VTVPEYETYIEQLREDITAAQEAVVEDQPAVSAE
jgi:hypothetical protein